MSTLEILRKHNSWKHFPEDGHLECTCGETICTKFRTRSEETVESWAAHVNELLAADPVRAALVEAGKLALNELHEMLLVYNQGNLPRSVDLIIKAKRKLEAALKLAAPKCGNCGGSTEQSSLDCHYYCGNPNCSNCDPASLMEKE